MLVWIKKKEIVRRVFSSGVKVFGVFSAILGLLYFYQERLIYIPELQGSSKSPKGNSAGLRNPEERGINYENIQIKSEDDTILRGWLLKQSDFQGSPTVVFFHENAGNIGQRLFYLEKYYLLCKVNILIVAYRGYSDSEGKPDEKGIQKDARAILKYVFEESSLNKKTVFLHGRSLGGAVAIYGASLYQNQINEEKIQGIILENTFSSIQNMALRIFPRFLMPFISLVLKNKWQSEETIENIQNNIFFIRSLMDEIVPDSHMIQLKKKAIKAKNISEFVIPNGDHNSNWTINYQLYFKSISNFIKQSLEKQN